MTHLAERLTEQADTMQMFLRAGQPGAEPLKEPQPAEVRVPPAPRALTPLKPP